jgi:hypothetical protein
MLEDRLPDFSGKIVVLYLRGASRPIQDGVVVEFPTFERFGGRLFLLGRVPDFVGSDWVSHLQHGLAWDDVISYLIFDSREQYVQRMRRSKRSLWRKIFTVRAD